MGRECTFFCTHEAAHPRLLPAWAEWEVHESAQEQHSWPPTAVAVKVEPARADPGPRKADEAAVEGESVASFFITGFERLKMGADEGGGGAGRFNVVFDHESGLPNPNPNC